jgi:hypothetical protein
VIDCTSNYIEESKPFKNLIGSQYSPIDNQTDEFDEEIEEDQAQDLSLHHLRTRDDIELKRENIKTYNHVSDVVTCTYKVSSKLIASINHNS